jgi:RimJ/RimL family protein N-acetyltransferase
MPPVGSCSVRCALATVGAVVAPEEGWSTDRLTLEPLTRAHAAELFEGLNDPHLHGFIGGSPLPLPALVDRYTRLEARRSSDGGQLWGNWVLRDRATGAAVGTLQATLPAGGPESGPAEVAWVLARTAQGHGYAREAATSLVGHLRDAGWVVIAHIHPEHLASQRVAHAAGLRPTGHLLDGEVRWELQPAPPPPT